MSEPTVYELRALLERPELLTPPPVVLPRLAWEGRSTLLAWPEKSGKSTLMGQGVAALVTGTPFLGQPTEPARVLWLALDEPIGDLVRRLYTYGARDGVTVCAENLTPGALERLITERGIRLVVVDTLTEFAAGIVDDLNAAVQWQPLLKALRGILQRTGAGGVLLHHSNKTTGKYRDSSQIGAGVDAIIEMTPAEEDPTVRRCKARGRMRMGDFVIRFVDPWYQLEAGELPLDMRIYRAVEARPGISKRNLRSAVGGKAKAIDAMIASLVRARVIEDRGENSACAYFTVSPLAAAGPGLEAGHAWDTPRDTPPANELSPLGHGGSRSGHGSGHTPCVPPPYTRGGDTVEKGDAWEPEEEVA